jgi:hypothetical protein
MAVGLVEILVGTVAVVEAVHQPESVHGRDYGGQGPDGQEGQD